FRFFNCPFFKILPLKVPCDKVASNTTVYRKKGEGIAFDRIRFFVVVNGTSIFKCYGGNVLKFFNIKNFIRRTDFLKRIANHLRTKRRDSFSNLVITQVMQSNTIPAPILNNERYSLVTCACKSYLRLKQRVGLFLRQIKFKGFRSFHIGNINKIMELKQTKEERGFLPHLKEGVSTSSIR